MTRVVRGARQLRSICDEYRAQGARVGLVPTMGALHQGHLSLIEAVRQAGASRTVVTIFVNPAQFGRGEDYGRYPRTLDNDVKRCGELGVDLVYAPETDAVYPPGFQTYVQVQELTKDHEGKFRPTHFRGVTTIVAKLFNVTGPCVAAFGRKDYQQWRVIHAMARDLDMPVEVIGCPIVRESDGLAMSSRNRYLNADERKRALAIYRGLCAAKKAFDGGERDALALERLVRDPVQLAFDKIDYVAVADPETLAGFDQRTREKAVVLVAAHIGSTRLIDNMLLGDMMPKR